MNVVPDGSAVPRIANTSNLLPWGCAILLNKRLRLGRDDYIESNEPPTVKARRLAVKRRRPRVKPSAAGSP